MGRERAIGDASTTNLVVPGAAVEIARDAPAARIVVVLRQPVDRAYAHYRHFVVAGGEDAPSFAEAVRREPERQAAGFPFTYQYLGWGRYVAQLAPFFDRFGRDRVLVHLYDDLCSDADGVIRATLTFLEVDATGPFRVGRENEVRALRHATLHRSLTGSGRIGRVSRAIPRSLRRNLAARVAQATVPPTPLDPDVRGELTAALDDEISRLEELLNRDLAQWR